MELTEEQLLELYNFTEDEDDEDDRNYMFYFDDPEVKDDWKPDFTKWVALINDDTDEFYRYNFYIAPSVFWDANYYIPDWCTGFKIPGFGEEIGEHKYQYKAMMPNEIFKKLRNLGFTIVEKE